MEVIGDFFDIIISNLFFVVLIIGAIFNFLKRKAGTENDEGIPNQHPGSDGEKRTPLKDIFQQFEDVFKEEEKQQPQAKPVQHRAPMAESNQSQELFNRYEQLKESKGKPDMRVDYQPKVQLTERSKRTVSTNLTVTKKKAVQGVLWAEVLGPPRAKRSFYSQRHSNIK
ncbi:hypothetical protein [Litchfieldia salsa]|uniref:Uncharacterized protein n=1 Tax=Litchfieldia salsa TaxID=930152 RepID=A0A1H0V9L4_9BACI|nr:hypothetical protein [Litchfieldia salsa]SDP75107.1 hypothetical protein SAMN05216565_106117 [Litchfieldia salsa]